MTKKNYERLSDHILVALTLALAQKDLVVADLLSSALEMTMTRGAGGRDFVERREFTAEVENAMVQLDVLRKSARG